MICVTIGRGRHKSMLAEWKAAAEAGAHLVELRIDCLRSDPELRRLLAERHTPVIITIPPGGRWRPLARRRGEAAAPDPRGDRPGVDYIDLEEDIADKVPRFGSTKRIVSYHNFRKTPADLEQLADAMVGKNADIVKIATLAHTLGEASLLLELVSKASRPTVGIAMGRSASSPGFSAPSSAPRSPTPDSTPTASSHRASPISST